MPSVLRRLQTTALPVGQGLAVKIRVSGIPGGFRTSTSFASTAVGDFGGPKESVERALSMARGDISLLVLSHFDADHISGVPRLLDESKVKRLWIPGRGIELRLSDSANNAVRLLDMGFDPDEMAKITHLAVDPEDYLASFGYSVDL